MKFNVSAVVELRDEEILEFVNEDQRYDDLEEFASVEEIPFELLLRSLFVVIEDEIYDLSPGAFEITKAE